MSPTRRDVFKITAGLGLTGTVPTVAERIAAATALDQQLHTSPVLDPATFADEVDGVASEHLIEEWSAALNAELYRRYIEAAERLKAVLPQFDVPGITPLSQYEEAVFALVDNFYFAGLRHGAAYEHLRREVIGDISQCRRCWGVGLTKRGTTCASCGGTGLVATGTQTGRGGETDRD